MTDNVPAAEDPAPSLAKTDEPNSPAGAGGSASAKKKDEGNFAFLFWMVLTVLALRSFVVAPFNIPSESMVPQLLKGDYLFATKWSYGYSKYSLPFSVPLIPGRVLPSQPERGDVVIFKAPPSNDIDYIKRVIGLPGDQVEVRAGQVFINGAPVPRVRQPDFILPVTTNTDCYAPQFEITQADGSPACSYPQFRETLPNGKSYNVLDLADMPQDDTPPVIVPAGHLFLMGDNRDNSMDSRFPAIEGKGIGLVPQKNLVGRAAVMMFSTDGSAEWLKPWTWFTAARWRRIGGTI